MIIELKTLFMIEVILSIVKDDPELVPVRSVICNVAPETELARACLKLLIITESVGLINFTSSHNKGRYDTSILLNYETKGMLNSRAAWSDAK